MTRNSFLLRKNVAIVETRPTDFLTPLKAWIRQGKSKIQYTNLVSSIQRNHVPVRKTRVAWRWEVEWPVWHIHRDIGNIGQELRDANPRDGLAVLPGRRLVVKMHVVEMLVLLQRRVVDMVVMHSLVDGVCVLNLLDFVRYVDHHFLATPENLKHQFFGINTWQFMNRYGYDRSRIVSKYG